MKNILNLLYNLENCYIFIGNRITMALKDKVLYTMSQEVSKEFNELAKEMTINKSALIEKLVKNWIKEQKSK